ncbi:MAG: HAD-IC family P-type ATPase [Candidatus Methanoperedenaceae archaeon]|nr:HAD-IC family P-type ATPase [Candidatus Methanoperedenaceae archaeon]
MAEEKWYRVPVEDIFSLLQSDIEGITAGEAELRLSRFGYNEVEVKKKHGSVYRFIKQFASPLIYILLAASVVTFFLEEYIDTAVILLVVIANAVIGFVQESKAEHALESLAKMLVHEATVLRGGTRMVIPSRELVAGDVVLMEAGDMVPADIRLFYVKNFRTDESILTGESVAVEKKTEPIDKENIPLADQKNISFTGTLVTQGLARGIVVSTGKDTEIGRISEFIRETGEISTPLVRKIARFGFVLSIVIIVLSLFTFAFGIMKGYDTIDIFLASVSLAVAAIPEGLPAVITISLAIGIKTMASRNAIIRSMPAVETLGSATVICSDKTGTLTKNQMTVTRVFTAGRMYQVSGAGYVPKGEFISEGEVTEPGEDAALIETLKAGTLCNDASLKGEDGIDGDPTEGALLISALKAGKFHLPRLDIIPFEPEQRFMATLHKNEDGSKIIYVKGSPEKIVEMCKLQFNGKEETPLEASGILKAADDMASGALRVLGMAYKKVNPGIERIEVADVNDLVFAGLQGMMDPPREEVMESIKKCKTAGIRVIMITGDHMHTANAIAKQLGIETRGFLSGPEIEKMTDSELEDALENVSVFARTSPEHKFRIVTLLQARGEVVAVTGDGINDAPALKKADIGIAMGRSGTEVAREASDIVLADDNFASIVTAVEEGRNVYSKIQRIILWTLPTNGGEGLVVMAAILFTIDLPLLPLHILWINTVTAIGLGVPITAEPKEKGLLKRHPRKPGEPLLLPLIKRRIVIVAVLMVTASYFLFFRELGNGVEIDTARTVVLNTFVFFEIFYLFNSKSMYDYVFRDILSNRFMLLGISIVIGLQLLITYHPFMNDVFGTAPLTLMNWVWIIMVSSTVFFIIEFEKYLHKRRNAHQKVTALQ